AAIAMTVNHLQDSIVATLLLQTASETCLLLVTKKDINIDGDCLHDQDELSSLTVEEEQEFLTVLVEQREGSVRVYLPAAPTHAILLNLADLSGGVHAQVSGVGPLNAAFDCLSGCLEVGNGTWVHSNGTLRLFVDPNVSDRMEGTMRILYGIDDREWKREKEFELSYDQYLTDFGDSKGLVIQPTFGSRIWGGYYLGVNKTLTKHRSGNIGAVPTKDLYVQFNNMNNFRWSLGCMLLNNVPMVEEFLSSSAIISQSNSNPEIPSNDKNRNEDEYSETSIIFSHDAREEENDSIIKEDKSEEIPQDENTKVKSFENYSDEVTLLEDNILESVESSLGDDEAEQTRSPISKVKKKSKVNYQDAESDFINENVIDDIKTLFGDNDSEENNTDITASNDTMVLTPLLINKDNTNIVDNSTIINMYNITDDNEPEQVSTLSTGFLFKIVIITGIVVLSGCLILICFIHGCKKKDGPSNKYQVSAQSSLKPPGDVIISTAADPPSYCVENPAYLPDN
ncbi:unnamed protein product, partial [Meganyctiphanes norvegica]